MHDSCVGCSEHFRNPKFMTPESHIKTQLSEKCTFIFKCYLSNKVRNVLVFVFFLQNYSAGREFNCFRCKLYFPSFFFFLHNSWHFKIVWLINIRISLKNNNICYMWDVTSFKCHPGAEWSQRKMYNSFLQ